MSFCTLQLIDCSSCVSFVCITWISKIVKVLSHNKRYFVFTLWICKIITHQKCSGDLSTQMVLWRSDAKWFGIQIFKCHLNTRLMTCHLVFLRICLVFKLSIYYIEHSTKTNHLNIKPFEYQTIWNSKFTKFGIQMFLVFKWLIIRSPL